MMRGNALTQWNRRNPWLWLAIALATLIVLTVVTAPNATKLEGSTYSRAPSGYGAWFEAMMELGLPVQRWQLPLNQLPTSEDISLLRVASGLRLQELTPEERRWVEQGNRLIVLGVRSPVSEAPFITELPSEVGAVKLETTRRHGGLSAMNERLGDRFGAAVWQQAYGAGIAVFAVTPHLAANAYQAESGNFTFLAQLVSPDRQPVWVDEYIHGYRDSDETPVATETAPQNWMAYLAQTPLMPGFFQLLILLGLLIWGMNQRFGAAASLSPAIANNSKAYIQALAAVLRKAQSSAFVIEVVGRHEQESIQRALGLERESLAPEQLLTAWMQRTGRPATELEQALRPYWRKQAMSETELLQWIYQVRSLHQHL